MKYLLIVESPAKAKTIENYLGSNYKVVSSVGHIRDLAKTGPGGLGIDYTDNFKASYTYISGKKKVVNDIKKEVKKVDKVIIATDPDREGEAIGWHLIDELLLNENELNRVSFNEITKEGVLEGMENIRTIDMNLVFSQEARRKIDRIMGFKLSKLLQKKIKAKSAGRVQSVALRIIVEREEEIRKFVPVEYWKLLAHYNDLEIEYINNHKQVKKEEIEELYEKSKEIKELKVIDVIEKTKKQKPKRAYTTSTFQQDSVNKLNFTSKKAMQTAQKLYEGIEIDSGLEGLITYMRTDSTRLSNQFVGMTKKYVEDQYGKDYVGSYFTKSKKEGQDAHEAIRPTKISNTPEKLKKYLTVDQYKVYKLIWVRSIACIMADANLETSTYLFENEEKVKFKISNTIVLFDGFKKVYVEEEKINNIKFEKDEVIKIKEYEKTQHFTKPNPRFTEAKLIKELEENGVGRPSTYASIIDTIKLRGYVELENKQFIPTEMGELVVNKLKEYFNDLVNVEYTSELEEKLDKIAIEQADEVNLIKEFSDKLEILLDHANEKMEKIEDKNTGEKCPECESDLVVRRGRYGEFVGCSNYPKCKYIKVDPQKVIAECPKCKEGNIVEKRSRRGKVFYACDKYPKCDFAVWDLKEISGDKNENI